MEWNLDGSLFQAIILSHLIFQIRYMDSETMILNRRFRLVSGFPFPFLKAVRQHPIKAP